MLYASNSCLKRIIYDLLNYIAVGEVTEKSDRLVIKITIIILLSIPLRT